METLLPYPQMALTAAGADPLVAMCIVPTRMTYQELQMIILMGIGMSIGPEGSTGHGRYHPLKA